MFTPFSYRALPFKLDWREWALVPRNHDGDSIWLLFDKGERQYSCANCRLSGIDTPEMNDQDPAVRAKAAAARDHLRSLVDAKELYVRSDELDKYGRPLVTIWTSEADFGHFSKSVNRAMIDAGHAVAYDGGAR